MHLFKRIMLPCDEASDIAQPMHFDVHKDKNILSVILVKQRKKSDLLSYRFFDVGCGAPYSILNQYVNTKGITSLFLFMPL